MLLLCCFLSSGETRRFPTVAVPFRTKIGPVLFCWAVVLALVVWSKLPTVAVELGVDAITLLLKFAVAA